MMSKTISSTVRRSVVLRATRNPCNTYNESRGHLGATINHALLAVDYVVYRSDWDARWDWIPETGAAVNTTVVLRRIAEFRSLGGCLDTGMDLAWVF